VNYNNEPKNKLVFVQTVDDIRNLLRDVERISYATTGGKYIDIDVSIPQTEYPLSWYWHDYPNVRYYSKKVNVPVLWKGFNWEGDAIVSWTSTDKVDGFKTISVTSKRDDQVMRVLFDKPVIPGQTRISISGIDDLAGNKMAPTKTPGNFISLQVLNIGDVDPTGVAHNFGDEIEVIAGGFDIWSNADDFTFLFEEKTGDFDMAVQVPKIDNPGGAWARNGLMVRETLDDNSMMLGAFATPSSGQGYFALERREESVNPQWWNNNGTPGSAVLQGGIKYGTDTVPGLPNLWIRMNSGNA
jgi:hypothetical protein